MRTTYGVWKTRRVRLSHFWQLMDDEFGAAYARSLARDHVVGALGNRSPQAALDAGTPPREVWLALCRDMDVPQEHWLGKEAPGPRAPRPLRAPRRTPGAHLTCRRRVAARRAIRSTLSVAADSVRFVERQW